MFPALFRFEWAYHTRQLTFWAAVFIFSLIGWSLGTQSVGGLGVVRNAPYNLAYGIALMSLIGILLVTVFSVAAILRDKDHKMAELVYTTSVRKLPFLSARYLGSLAAALTVLAVAVVVMYLCAFLPGAAADRYGTTSPLAYLWMMLLFTVPNLLMVGAALFLIASITRNAPATYVGGVLLYMLYFVGATLLNSPAMAASSQVSPQGLALAALADPFGISAFFQQTQYWSTAQRNSQWLALEGYLLWNRLLWGTVTALLLALNWWRFRFHLKLDDDKKQEDLADTDYNTETLSTAKTHSGTKAQWAALKANTRMELSTTLRSRLFWGFQTLWIVLAVVQLVSDVNNGNFGSPSLPYSALMLNSLMKPMGIVLVLLITYFGAELCWRERSAAIDELKDATPTANFCFYMAKLVALATLIFATIFVGYAVAISIQLGKGYYLIEPGLYLAYAWFQGSPFVLIGVLALLVHSLMPNKYVGILMVMVLCLNVLRGNFFGMEHMLVCYAMMPPVFYDLMNGFGNHLAPFHWFLLYWTATASTLALLTLKLWRRGTDSGIRNRMRGLPNYWTHTSKGIAAGALLLMLLSGGFIYYNTNILNKFETTKETLDWKAAYERKYSHWDEKIRPKLTKADLIVDLYPKKQSATIKGQYRYENKSDEPLDQFLLSLRRDLEVTRFEIDGADLVNHDKVFNMYHFQPKQPLLPGEAFQMKVDLNINQKGFSHGGPRTDIVENGTFLMFMKIVPIIGYRGSYEIKNNHERKKRGLEPIDEDWSWDQGEGHDAAWHGRLNYSALISTDTDQTALTSGVLKKQWVKDERAYFQYQSSIDVSAHLGIMSARYEIQRREHNGTQLEIYHHPGHDYNIERMFEASKESLDYFEQAFGPYPFPHFRIFEFPSHHRGGSGIGFADTIGFLSNRGFLADLRDPDTLDLVYRRTAHELAHQWWGHQNNVSIAPGGGFLVESFTKYSEMLVLEQRYGRAYMRGHTLYEMDRYLKGRSNETEEEMPLAYADDSYLIYSKGTVVLYGLRDIIGEEILNQAMRSTLNGGQNEISIDSTHFLKELYALAPKEHHQLIKQWLERITFYELSLSEAKIESLPNNKFKINLTVKAQITEANGKGEERPLEVDMPVPIGLFTDHPSQKAVRTIYLKPHHLKGETSQISIIVDEKPATVAIDPWANFVDRNLFDNVKSL